MTLNAIESAGQEVKFKDSSMTSPLTTNLPISNLVELMTDDNHWTNSLIFEDTIEQSTLQETENSHRNFLTDIIDHSIFSSSSNQIDELIWDESMQGLVPYKMNSDSETYYEIYSIKSRCKNQTSMLKEKKRSERLEKKYYGRIKMEIWNSKAA